MSGTPPVETSGSAAAGFRAVRAAFERNFALRHELGGGVGAARAIPLACGVIANDGCEPGLPPETLAAGAAPAVPGGNGFYDEFMRTDAQFSLGFMKSNPGWAIGSAQSYGAPGAGGSLGHADPLTGIGYAYVNKCKGTHLEGDPCDIALRRALDAIVSPAAAAD